jgi:hypothetical protein
MTFPNKIAHFSLISLGVRGLGFRIATFALVWIYIIVVQNFVLRFFFLLSIGQ